LTVSFWGPYLIDEHCNVTTYEDGEAFAAGLDVHMAVAGAGGADFYSAVR
jgi:hypothetical protein